MTEKEKFILFVLNYVQMLSISIQCPTWCLDIIRDARSATEFQIQLGGGAEQAAHDFVLWKFSYRGQPDWCRMIESQNK